MTGLYIHIPFCASKCGYCDFYSVTDRSGRRAYTDAVLREIRRFAGRGLRADSLYFGGGTPSMLEAELLGEMIAACREIFSLEGEITAEANPDSASFRWLSALRRAGANRISFGAQSSDARELSALGRRHSPEQIGQAVCEAREAGFDRISLDVMLGIPYQTPETLRETLVSFAALGVEHISAYLLKIEPGTPFAVNGAERLCPDEDAAAALYLQTVRELAGLGFAQYEISNFARPDGACRHNLKYWRAEEYIGFGPAAHSLLGGRRFYHPRGLAEYLASDGRNLVPDGPGGGPEERLMLGLRLTAGVDPAALNLSERGRARLARQAEIFRKAGLMAEGPQLRLTPRGFLVSNAVIGALMEILDGELLQDCNEFEAERDILS